MRHILIALAIAFAIPVSAAASDPLARLHSSRAAFLASLPTPFPANPWSIRNPPAGSTRSEALAAYDSAIAEAYQWSGQANAADLLPRKGIWIRPYRRDATALELLEVLDNAQSLGITDIFVETFWGGRLIYPGNPAFPARYPENLLSLYVQEGRRRGMKVHAWLHTLDFGSDWAKRHPNALVQDGFGRPSTVIERGSYMVSPALAEVREELSRILTEVASHAADGVILDYLRYPSRMRGDDIDETPDPRNFFGYNERQFQLILRRHADLASPEFKTFLDTGIPLNEEQREALLERWKRALSEDIEGLIALLRTRLAGKLQIGAAYFPDYYFHRHDNRVQESRRWAGMFELLAPMCYQYYLDEYPAPYGNYTVNRALEIADAAIAYLAPEQRPLLMPVLAAEVPGTPLEAPLHHRTLREQVAFLKGRIFDGAFKNVKGLAYFSYGWIYRDSEARRRSGG
ncbi:MAG: hypothetical protein HY692_03175 [Cyanobacteria bacterium NC_groundwater_1444_Ag_S-0.65um_54_12]|nr:hypothetical protein [Cyanobacteria bacterium NC_groundwater_1444_Ag_S-0.65um_54_12]